MPSDTPKLRKDRETIALKFHDLIAAAESAAAGIQPGHTDTETLRLFPEIRARALNLIRRLASTNSEYYRELRGAPLTDHLALVGILRAARADYLEGFMADHELLISAEVFTDLLVQAEILIEHDYKDAAAVITRAVLEDGLRRLSRVNEVDVGKRDTLQQVNEALYRKGIYNALIHKEIIAKSEIGNCAAHGRFDQYSKADVVSFLEFVTRFLGQHLR